MKASTRGEGKGHRRGQTDRAKDGEGCVRQGEEGSGTQIGLVKVIV